MFKKKFSEVEEACALAQAMVDTVREPMIVLDKDLRVIAASRSFYVKYATNPDDSRGKHLYELGNGEWDIPRLRPYLLGVDALTRSSPPTIRRPRRVSTFLASLGLRPFDVGSLHMAATLESLGLMLIGLAKNGAPTFDIALHVDIN